LDYDDIVEPEFNHLDFCRSSTNPQVGLVLSKLVIRVFLYDQLWHGWGITPHRLREMPQEKKEQILQVYRGVLRDFGSLKGMSRFSVHLVWPDPHDWRTDNHRAQPSAKGEVAKLERQLGEMGNGTGLLKEGTSKR
jgi:hypothetical protein